MAFPSTLTAFTYPNANQKLSSPSHSSVHVQVASAVGQIETIIGRSGNNSTLGTLIGDLRSPDSDGGGHVQTAVKGGTGQTTFTKGDFLVATGPSVISKLAVGADGQIIKADSSVAAGVKWATDSTPKVVVSVLGSIVGQNVVTEGSVFSVTIPGSILGTSNAIRATLKAKLTLDTGTSSMITHLTYGGGRVASVVLAGTTISAGERGGGVECWIVGMGSSSVQQAVITPLFGGGASTGTSVITMGMDSGSSSVASDAPQTLGITWRFSDLSTGNKLVPVMVVVEKIT